MRKKYNHKFYHLFQKGNKLLRDKITPDPLEKLKDYGVVGKIANKAGNKVLEKPIHNLSYGITGVVYNPKKDKPYKGSILYTITKYAFCSFLLLMVTGLLTFLINK